MEKISHDKLRRSETAAGEVFKPGAEAGVTAESSTRSAEVAVVLGSEKGLHGETLRPSEREDAYLANPEKK